MGLVKVKMANSEAEWCSHLFVLHGSRRLSSVPCPKSGNISALPCLPGQPVPCREVPHYIETTVPKAARGTSLGKGQKQLTKEIPS